LPGRCRPANKRYFAAATRLCRFLRGLVSRFGGWTGVTLMLLSAGIVVDVIRRFLFGSDPLGAAMVGFSLLSLFVNVTVLRMLLDLYSR
jgi:hypothetical protein